MNEKSQHHQSKADDNDDLEDPGRNARKEDAARLLFRLNEGHRCPQQEKTNRASKQINDAKSDFLGRLGEQSGHGIDIDVAPLPGSQRGTDEADPEHQMAQKGISPEDRGVEKISQDHLQKSQQNHAEQNDDEQDGFDSSHYVIGGIDKFYHKLLFFYFTY